MIRIRRRTDFISAKAAVSDIVRSVLMGLMLGIAIVGPWLWPLAAFVLLLVSHFIEVRIAWTT